MSAAVEARALFRALLRESRRFPFYNIREYAQRRAREGFRENAQVDSPTQIQSLLEIARTELQVLKRQSLVYGAYGRKFKNVLELEFKSHSEEPSAELAK